MPETFGTHETATLIVLILENREVPNPELISDYGIRLSKPAREKLNEAGLLKSRLENRRYVHSITEAGIDWCERELQGVEPPSRPGPLVRVAFEVLRRLVGHLRRNDLRLVDVLRPPDLESLIRAAYRELSVKQQDWVRLATLRPRLDGADRDDVDRVLLAMTRTGLVHLAPSSNRKGLADADRDAAISIGGEPQHLVAIEES
jgi:hypothetical protein